MWFWGLGLRRFKFRVSDLGIHVQSFGVGWALGSVFRITCYMFQVSYSMFHASGGACRVLGHEFRVLGSEFRVPGSGFRIPCFMFRIPDSVFRVSGFGRNRRPPSLPQAFLSSQPARPPLYPEPFLLSETEPSLLSRRPPREGFPGRRGGGLRLDPCMRASRPERLSLLQPGI